MSQALYERALPANRTGALYGAFPYPTKISPEAIALFIAAHTKPGDTVFDGFAGSGTTGLAALLCEDPSTAMRAEAERMGLDVKWGARNAVLYDIGGLGSFIARTLTNPPDPKAFVEAAETILADAEANDAWLYRAKDPAGESGVIRYVVWTEKLRCTRCRRTTTMWDACVGLSPARIASDFTCRYCGHRMALDDAGRPRESTVDPITGEARTPRVRVPAQVYGITGRKTWSRPTTKEDLLLIKRIERETIPPSVPLVKIPWGDLYRSGYHEGLTHLHHFYTRRNLLAFARMWDRTSAYEGPVGEALRFWLLSYNASHATIMSRVVAKSGQKDLVITSAQPGVLYVSGLPVEKNVLLGFRRKLKTIAEAFQIVKSRKGKVVVEQRSSCRVNLPNNSIDYAFTDPPFGGNIPYAEVNFLNEAWLNRCTDTQEEIIVSKHQQKSMQEYEALMTRAMKEIHRILKPRGKVTVVFHSAAAEVWNALQGSYQRAGFRVERTSILDKTQGSFKQVTTKGAVRGDPLLLLTKGAWQPKELRDVWDVAEKLRTEAYRISDPEEVTAQRLYSRFVTHFLNCEQPVPLDAESFYEWLAAKNVGEVIGAQAG
ncbi:MAG: DNA methyltransferase [Bradyrhizobium sp.]|uniref:DNA methyltransferase n=1 Tax=Bradyrhizobium sp. TaxID=376 RepID=UPI0029B2FF11|nr:DNA methyltransferase [Bradyrhizobium sp.]MDX3968134.1 DNA methyltransferase [Bradyrhizobium sp.]